MTVHVKLLGVLKEKTPEGDKLDLPDGATIASALEALDISEKSVQVVSINGTFERDFSRALQADDKMTVLAPVGAG